MFKTSRELRGRLTTVFLLGIVYALVISSTTGDRWPEWASKRRSPDRRREIAVYEQYGFSRTPNGDQLRLFVPDNSINPTQYSVGGPCRIASVGVIGDFQSRVNPKATNWDVSSALPMAATQNANGYLYTFAFSNPLPNGYYQYKYVVAFSDKTVRIVGDPCTKYGGDSDDRSAFVVGGTQVGMTDAAKGLANRLATEQLRIYELMIDDFTKEYRGAQAPLDAVVQKLDYLTGLNINAIEFMPWTAWPDDVGFSWGYNPAYFFSVESQYVDGADSPLDRLSRLANLVNECHKRNLHVILDIVLQHTVQGSSTNGFPYYWLWQNPGTECPFIGQFVNANDFGMLPLNYTNACTQQFVGDVCRYWMDRFSLDGFRFDQVTGYNNPQFPQKGAPELIAQLTAYINLTGRTNFSLILEDSWGFDCVADANAIKPTGTWFDPFRSGPFGIFTGYAVKNFVDTTYMRILNAALEFNYPTCPVNYIENHDHGSVTCRVGSRDRWFKTQPYMIALATCSGAMMLHNGQEWGQFEDIWEDDTNAPPAEARVQSRPLIWTEQADPLGKTIQDRYRTLLRIRQEHPGLQSPNFYPDYYDEQWTAFSPDGYGINESLQVAIYHRWGNDANGDLELFIIVLNFSDTDVQIDIPFPTNGTWTDLLNGNATKTVSNFWLRSHTVPSNWGSIYWQ